MNIHSLNLAHARGCLLHDVASPQVIVTAGVRRFLWHFAADTNRAENWHGSNTCQCCRMSHCGLEPRVKWPDYSNTPPRAWQGSYKALGMDGA